MPISSRTVAVGGEIDAWCTKCKRELNHTVVAMLGDQPRRVQCLTCSGQHNFRPRPPDKTPVARVAAPVKRKSSKQAFTDDPSVPGRDYRMTDSYGAGEVILHPTFGRGRVTVTRGNKIDVEFAGIGAKTLGQATK